jgi:hypothetical protein
MSDETLDELKRRVRETVAQERRESDRLIRRATVTLAGGNGHAAVWPRDQEPRMSQAERDQLRRDLEAAGVEIEPGSFTDRVLRDGS